MVDSLYSNGDEEESGHPEQTEREDWGRSTLCYPPTGNAVPLQGSSYW